MPDALAKTTRRTRRPTRRARRRSRIGPGHGAFLNDDDAATIAAFTERLMPGAPGKPGARDAGVLNYIDLALSGAYADLQDFYRRGLAALDAYCRKTHNAPFAQLDAAQQDEVIAALEQGKATGFTWPTPQAFFNTRAHAHDGRHVRRPDLRRQQGLRRLAAGRFPRRATGVLAGGHARARKRSPAPPSSACRRRPRRGGDEPWQPKRLMSSSSASARQAAILAAELGKAGMKVIGLERGPRLTTQDFNPHDELRYFQRQDLRPNIKRQPITWRPNANARANPIPVQNYGNQAGGGTVHYGAVSWRLHEDDFRARSQTIERYGANAIPADSSLADWPLSYADLEPYYDQAEYELGVSGKAGNLQGRKIDGGNVFEAPRRREFPLPPLRVDQIGRSCSRTAPRSSAITRSRRRARSSREAYKGRPGCTYCGFCQAFGCHVGAKSSMLVTKLPRGRCHRQLQADHRRDVLSRQQRQQRQGDRRRLLRARRLGQHDRGRDRHPDAVHLRQHPAAAAVEDGQVPERPGELERARWAST